MEASRRAEVIALANAARDEAELGRGLVDELCEAYEAEVAFLLDSGAGGAAWRIVAAVGIDPMAEATLTGADWGEATAADAPMQDLELPVDGGGRYATLVASFTGSEGRHAVIGVARLEGGRFDDAETALLAGISTGAGHALERIWGFQERDRLIEQLESLFLGTVQSLANALEAKDRGTADHAPSMVDLAVAVGRRVGFMEGQLEDLRHAAIFHDIGKFATPDAILSKPGPLNEAERALIREHTIFGEQILAPVPRLSGVRKIVRHDHERWDGDGYPDGLRAEEIPLASRIVFVVDAYKAMISDRPYREALPREHAIAELRDNAGTQFDPEIVGEFLAVLDEGRAA